MPRTAVGVDIGAQHVKLVRLAREGGKIKVLEVVRMPRQMPRPIGGPGAEADGLRAVGRWLSQSRRSLREATVGISGNDLLLRYLHLAPIPKGQLEDIVGHQAAEALGVRREEASWDHQILAERAGAEMTVLVAAAKSVTLDEKLRRLAQCQIRVRRFCPDAIGLFHAVRHSHPADRAEVTLAIDIGAEKIELVILQNDTLLFARTVTPGGEAFTRAVADALGGNAAQAEQVKRQRGAIVPPAQATRGRGREKHLADALYPVAEELASTLRSSLKFAGAQTKMPSLEVQRIILTGGGAKLKGLADYFAQALDLPVERLDVTAEMDLTALPSGEAAVLREAGGEMAVPLGLALAGLENDDRVLSLLPERLKRHREFRERTLFGYIGLAAAIFLAFVTVLGATHNYRLETARTQKHRALELELVSQDKAFDAFRRQIKQARSRLQLIRQRVLPGAGLLRTLVEGADHNPGGLSLQSCELMEIPGQPDTARVVLLVRVAPEADQPREKVEAFCAELRTLEKDRFPRIEAMLDQATDPPAGQPWKVVLTIGP